MPRITQRNIQPTAIKPASLSQQTLINNSTVSGGPFSMNNGDSFTIKVLVKHDTNSQIRLSAVPFSLIFFEDTLDTSSIIGAGVTGYQINGPFSMPPFTPLAYLDNTGAVVLGGSDGNNLVYFTEIVNNSGGTHDIYVYTNTRAYIPIGGQSGL